VWRAAGGEREVSRSAQEGVIAGVCGGGMLGAELGGPAGVWAVPSVAGGGGGLEWKSRGNTPV